MSESVPHTHRWKMTGHLDTCHRYSTAYVCECGATATSSAERDIESDPYSFCHFRLGEDEDGKCERCVELASGAPTEEDEFLIMEEEGAP